MISSLPFDLGPALGNASKAAAMRLAGQLPERAYISRGLLVDIVERTDRRGDLADPKLVAALVNAIVSLEAALLEVRDG